MATTKQQAILEALDARPDYWITEASDLAEAAGLTDRGALIVLYHLSDAGVVSYDEHGWHRAAKAETFAAQVKATAVANARAEFGGPR